MRNRLIPLLILLFLFSSCSSMTVYSSLAPTKYSSRNANFNMTVSSANKVLSDYINNLAYFEFSKYVPINEQKPLTGTIEVTFETKDKTVHNISTSTHSNTYTSGEAELEHHNEVEYRQNQTTIANQNTEMSSIDYQNSTMFVIMKDINGNRFWGAHYNYKGETEIMGVFVNTPQEAAKVCIKKVAEEIGGKFSR